MSGTTWALISREEESMTLEEAIRTAIDYETRVRDTYLDSAEKAADEVGKRVFKVLSDEEQGHLDYLCYRLEEWKKSGKITPERITTIVPPMDVIEAGIRRLDSHLTGAPRGSEIDRLQEALQVEMETSAFYQRMVDEMGDEGKMFARFLEIERGHQAIVQAEIDYLTNTGFYFDFQEFSLEQ
jgi:rubrerythrin